MAKIFLIFLIFYAATTWERSPYDAHVRQAQAFDQGHAWFDCPDYIERALVNGKRYELHPPLPALMLMPLVAVGMTNQNWFAIAVGALDLALAFQLLLTLKSEHPYWLTAFFGAGTIMWTETVNGASWEVSMLVAVLMTLLALNELFSENPRAWLIGLCAGLAAIARYDLALVWPVYALMIPWRQWWKLAPGFALAAIIYVWFNWVRYGSPFDQGLLYYNPDNGNLPVTTHRILFAWRYFPSDFYTLFFSAPHQDDKFPYIHPCFAGQSILTTSPAFLVALNAKGKDAKWLGLMALIAALPVLFYVGNGASQFGTRHFVHVFPFLLALMGMAKLDRMGKVLIVMSILLMVWGVWNIRMYGLVV